MNTSGALRAYIDDSGERDTGAATSRYFVYGAVIVPLSAEQSINARIAAEKVRAFGLPDVEIKSNWLRHPKERERRYLQRFTISPDTLDELAEAIVGIISSEPIELLGVAIDKQQLAEKYGPRAMYPSTLAYQILLQRFEKHLAARNARGLVTMDDTSGATPKANQWRDLMKQHHARLKKYGCNLTHRRFEHVSESFRFGDSARFHLLQCADLVAYNIFRHFREYGARWDNGDECPVYPQLKPMLPRFLSGPNGVVEGFGIVKFPRLHQGRYRPT